MQEETLFLFMANTDFSELFLAIVFEKLKAA